MKKLNLTKREKLTIGGFIFGKSVTALNKSDSIDVLIVLKKHKIINESAQHKLVDEVNKNKDGIVEKISGILLANITDVQGSEIMDEYLGVSP